MYCEGVLVGKYGNSVVSPNQNYIGSAISGESKCGSKDLVVITVGGEGRYQHCRGEGDFRGWGRGEMRSISNPFVSLKDLVKRLNTLHNCS